MNTLILIGMGVAITNGVTSAGFLMAAGIKRRKHLKDQKKKLRGVN